eukprot:9227727-Ditylum_brightwellii.AAC.1
MNYCQLYLNITTLIDITLADRNTLDPHMWSGNRSLLSSKLKHLKTKQQHPGSTSWKIWSKFMSLLVQGDQLDCP